MIARRSEASSTASAIFVPGTSADGAARKRSSDDSLHVMPDDASSRVAENPANRPAGRPTTPPRPGPCADWLEVEWQTAQRASKSSFPRAASERVQPRELQAARGSASNSAASGERRITFAEEYPAELTPSR